MRDRADGMRVGREVAGMAADAVASSVEDLLGRLRARRPPGDEPDAAAAAAQSPTGGPLSPLAELVGAALAEVLPAVLARIDLDEVLDRVDVHRVVQRIDIDEIVAGIDLDALAARMDLDALVSRIDVDAVVRRIDLAAATAEALEAVDIGDIIRDSTATIGSDVVEGLREQAMRADDMLAGVVDRLLGRRGRRTVLGGGAPR